MSINQWLQSINNPIIWFIFFASLPLIAFITGFFHRRTRGEQTQLRYVYSVLTYVSTIPGTLSMSLIGYSIFFTRSNLLDVNAIAYFLPLLSMLVTLLVIGKQAEFSELPGFDKLSGLIVLLLVTFGIVLLIFKTRIFIGIFASMKHVLVFAVLVYFLLKWSLKKINGK